MIVLTAWPASTPCVMPASLAAIVRDPASISCPSTTVETSRVGPRGRSQTVYVPSSPVVTSTLRRDTLIPCKPADPKAADDACTAAMIRKYAPKLFRRPVTEGEVQSRVALARQVATEVPCSVRPRGIVVRPHLP